MLVICYDVEALKDIRALGVNGDIVGGIPVPEDVREQANELGCWGDLASFRNPRNGRLTFIGIVTPGVETVIVRGGEDNN